MRGNEIEEGRDELLLSRRVAEIDLEVRTPDDVGRPPVIVTPFCAVVGHEEL
jgi:hypothetical protein